MGRRRTDAEIGALVRAALRDHRLRPRRLDSPSEPVGYEESDDSFVENNFDAVVALLAALAPSRRKRPEAEK